MRTSGVKLVAEVDQYKRGTGEAAKSTDVLKRSIDDVGQSSTTAGRKVDDLGGDFRDTARDARVLKDEIQQVERSLSGLAREFAATSSAADRLDLTKSIRKQQGEMRQLLKVQNLLPSPAEVEPAGRGFGAKLMGAMGKGLEAVPLSPPMMAAVGGAALATAPLLGATISAAVIGGAGIGGVIGGLMVAAKDPQVKAAADSMAGRIQERLTSAGSAFVQPAIRGLAEVERAVDGIDLESIFRDSATFVPSLTRGLTSAITEIGDAVESLVHNAGPVVDVIGRGIADIGRSLGNGLDSLSDNSEDAAAALKVIFGLISSGITTTMGLINVLTELYGISHKLGFDFGLQLILKLTGSTMDKTKESTDLYAGATRTMGREVEVATHKHEALEDILARVADRNLDAAESSIRLREATKAAADAVDKKRTVTDKESSALIAMARATNTSSKALDEQGRSAGEATKAHETNRRKLVDVAIQMGYSRERAEQLAKQYLATPKNVNTNINQPGMPRSREQMRLYNRQMDDLARRIDTSIKVVGDREAGGKLERLLIQQQALKKGISISAAASAFNKNAYAEGGWTGPGSKYQPAGIVHADEHVTKAESRQRLEAARPGGLDYMNQTGRWPGYAGGGRVLSAPFPVNASITQIMSLAEALSKVAPSFGNWPSSPGAQRGDSGVWRSIVQLIKSTGPMSGSFGNGYRPGDPLWHGSGRAVDWMGYNQDGLARFLAAKRPLELIHRTKNRDYAYTRGRNMGSFNSGLMNAHRNHIHIAMANGGVIREPVFGVGASGATYSLGERGHEAVTPMYQTAGASAGAAGASVTYISVAVTAPVGSSPKDVGRAISDVLDSYCRGGGRVQLRGTVTA